MIAICRLRSSLIDGKKREFPTWLAASSTVGGLERPARQTTEAVRPSVGPSRCTGHLRRPAWLQCYITSRHISSAHPSWQNSIFHRGIGRHQSPCTAQHRNAMPVMRRHRPASDDRRSPTEFAIRLLLVSFAAAAAWLPRSLSKLSSASFRRYFLCLVVRSWLNHEDSNGDGRRT